jgi:hypothetical protein
LLEPLVEALERSEARAREQAETIGQPRAELAVANDRILTRTAPQSPVEAPAASESLDPNSEPSSPWRRRWRAWLAAGLVVVVLGSASCQTSASTKHAELCAKARSDTDVMAADEKFGGGQFWPIANNLVDVTSKTC